MRHSLTAAAGLLAAVAMLLSPTPSFAARALQPRELLAAAYQAKYDAANKAGDDAVDPEVGSRLAAQRAAKAVADSKSRTGKQSKNLPAAEEVAFKAATTVLKSAPPGWEETHVKTAYNDAWTAAYKALEKRASSDPAVLNAAQGLPSNLESITIRRAKIRADQNAATVAAARAVARAVSERIAADESADNAADGHAASDQNPAK